MDSPPPPPAGLIERGREWAVLSEALDAARAGSGRLVVVEGHPGVGKTRLLDGARGAGGASGLEVLRARGTELEREFPFGVCLQLFEPVLADADGSERARLLAGSAAIAAPLFSGPGAEISAPPGEESHALAHGLYWLACNLAESVDGLLLTVDDAQWGDAGSLAFLAHLALRLEDLPVALVLALRTGAPQTPRTVAELRDRAAPGGLLRLAPFSDPGVDLVARATFPDAEGEFTQACARASGGNPFLLGELLHSLQTDEVMPTAQAAAGVEKIVPDSVLSSVLARLAHLPEEAAALAAAAAVLGDGASLRAAAVLAELDTQSAESATDALTEAHILNAGEPLSFTHPLIASAVEADLPAFAATRAHRRAAELIAEDGAPAEAVAAHLLASRGEDQEWAVEVLAAAADRASASGDYGAAARLLARALEEPPARERRPELVLALARAETAAGLPDAPGRMAEALELLDDPHQRALALQAIARLLLARARYSEAGDALESGLRELPQDDPLTEKLLSDLLAVWFFLPGRRAEADPRVSSLLDRAREGRAPDEPSLLAPLAATLACQGSDANLVRPLAEAGLSSLAGSEEVTHGVLMAFAVAALLFVEELDLAERALGRALERARGQGSAVAYAIACHWQARVSFRRGRLAESVAFAEQAIDLGRTGGWSAAALADAQIERGDLERAVEAIALIERGDGGGIEHAFLLNARGRLAQARGDDEAAFEDLQAAGRHLRDSYRFDNPIMLGWREPAALAALRLGDSSAASGLADAALARAQELGSEGARGAALRAAGLAAGGEKGIRLLTEAVAALGGSPAVLEHARALVDLGGSVRRSGERVAAREPLRRGLELADGCGAVPLADRAREELRASGARPRRAAMTGVDSLTPSELRVAKLAAESLTNKQIAQTLFVTSKTVESHLRHAFQKLDLRSRDELPAALGRKCEPGRARIDEEEESRT